MKEESIISFDRALQIVLESVVQKDPEIVSIHDAAGRINYLDIVSDINIPSFDNSAMDGYAIHHTDTKGASSSMPVHMQIVGEIQAGEKHDTALIKKNTAIRIMTGAPIPPGADSVIPVEYASEDEAANTVQIFKEMKLNENVRFAGEDITVGQIIIKNGERIDSAEIGLLAAINKKEVSVYKKPDVAIISTGNEIVEVGEEIITGQVRNTNAYSLASEVKKYNGAIRYVGIAKDELKSTRQIFIKAMDSDIIISTGGVSKGKYDLVKDVLADLGVEIVIEKVNMKPGRPIVFGKKGDKIFFGLPGNPVSTLVAFLEFVRPAMLKISGSKKLKKPEIYGILDDEIKKKESRKEFIRGHFYIQHNTIHVKSTGPQGSGILRSMSDANCLIIIPEQSSGGKAGDNVLIQLIEHEEIY